MEHWQSAAANDTKDAGLKKDLVNQYRNLAFVCLEMSDAPAGAAAAQRMAEVFGDRRQDWYIAACFQARATAKMPKGPAAEAILMQCLHSLRTVLNTSGEPLRREDTE